MKRNLSKSDMLSNSSNGKKNISSEMDRFKVKAMLVRSKILNIIYLCLLFVFIFSIYLLVDINGSTNHYVSSIANGKLSILMTVDGLITTSTFAFVAFIKISPNSSGSSTVMNRASWRGVWFFRYHILLIFSVILTISNCFFSVGDWFFFVFIGTTLSGIILLCVIIKYVLFNKNLNRNSSKAIMYVLITPYSYKGAKRDFRNLIHPLRGTTNVDFLKDLYTRPPMLNLAIDDLGKTWEDFLWPQESEKDRKMLYIYKKINNIIKSNKMDNVTKMELGVWIFIEMNNKSHFRKITPDFDRNVYNHFRKLFVDMEFLGILPESKISKKQSGSIYKDYERAKDLFDAKYLLDEEFESEF